MKEGIHPEYPTAKVVCACGAAYDTRSTRGNFSVEVCAACHPFYTGKQKMLDTKGRVDRFRKKYATKDAPAKLIQATREPRQARMAAPASRRFVFPDAPRLRDQSQLDASSGAPRPALARIARSSRNLR